MTFIPLLKIIKPFGVRGEIIVNPYHDLLSLKKYPQLINADGNIFKIKSIKPHGKSFIANINPINDRNMAEHLRNVELGVTKDQLPEITEDDTWYHADLIGCTVYDENEKKIGTVIAVNNFGAGDFFVISAVDNDKTTEYSLPFTNDAVINVDVSNKKIMAFKDFLL